MITGELKSKVDKIWSYFWTAGITVPTEVLNQLTYLLYMKMLDDQQIQEEQNANAWGLGLVDPIFPEGVWHNPTTEHDVPYQDMRWSHFKNMGSVQMYDMVRNNVFEFIKTIGRGENSAYSRFMKTAIFMVPDMHVLQDIVDGIEDLSIDTTQKDLMGDVYEYCLSKLATSGVNGQFRTPRHIIKMIVEMMKPTPKDIICDPAMGTAGFLVEAVKYVKEHHAKELMDENERHKFENRMINGFDTDQIMLRTAAMNLVLQGIKNPQIDYRDSVSVNNTDEGVYTMCIANPPFTGSVNKNNINPKLTAMVNTTKTELLFIAQFIRSLQLGGRCASIVPDGVLFGNSNTHKAIRKEIVDKQCLQAVISLPSGVFKPYAGVSTAILIFTRTDNGGTDKVWFYEMHADGFSLDDKRQEVKENDIADILARWDNLAAEGERTRKDQSFLVPVEEIRENDYDLTFNKYKEIERVAVKHEDPKKILKHIEELEGEIQKAIADLKGMIE